VAVPLQGELAIDPDFRSRLEMR